MKKIVITGANGFVAKNVISLLNTFNKYEIIKITREDDVINIKEKITEADVLFHFAGVNRPENDSELEIDNFQYTKFIIDEVVNCNKKYLFAMSSSTQAILNNQYGLSKRKAEDYIIKQTLGSKIFSTIYRFPGIFGAGCRPNYNSVVATFCYNIMHNKPLILNNPDTILNLMHIDNVSYEFILLLNSNYQIGKVNLKEFENPVNISLKNLADLIKYFYSCYSEKVNPKLNNSFETNLYNTLLTYL